jgi:hypothetical protein
MFMASKHKNASSLIGRGLYDNLRSFAELEQRISALDDEIEVRDAFEVFVEGFIATNQKMQAAFVWPVNRIPDEIRKRSKLPTEDQDVCGVFRTRTGLYVPYQATFSHGRQRLLKSRVTQFLIVAMKATDRIVFTNANGVAADARSRNLTRTVRGIDFKLWSHQFLAEERYNTNRETKATSVSSRGAGKDNRYAGHS